jgi:putative colanic acid biosynthesis UDP-glucose lipid carrier transferase
MYKNHQNSILTYMKTPLILTDGICSNMAFVAAFFLSRSYWTVDMQETVSTDLYSMWVLFNLVAIVSVLHLRLYANSTFERLENILQASWKSILTLLLVFTGCTLIEHRFIGVAYFLGALAIIVVVYVVLSRLLLSYIYTVFSRRFGWSK